MLCVCVGVVGVNSEFENKEFIKFYKQNWEFGKASQADLI